MYITKEFILTIQHILICMHSTCNLLSHIYICTWNIDRHLQFQSWEYKFCKSNINTSVWRKNSIVIYKMYSVFPTLKGGITILLNQSIIIWTVDVMNERQLFSENMLSPSTWLYCYFLKSISYRTKHFSFGQKRL